MKTTIKLLSILLTLVMVFQTGAVGFAANAAENPSAEIDEQEIKTFYDGDSRISGEIEELREENVKHFSLENGANVAVVYSEPVHYQDSDGDWKEIDNSLVFKDGAYSPRASGMDLRLPQNIENGSKIEFSKDGYDFSMSVLLGKDNKSEKTVVTDAAKYVVDYGEDTSAIKRANAETIESKTSASKVEYKAALNGADLEYTVSSSKIKEDIVVTGKQDNYEYKFELNYGDLIPVTNSDGSIGFFKSENDEEAIYTIAAPYMVDANGEYSDDVKMILEGNILTVIADEKWINSNKREFPVRIDPTVNINSGSFIDASVRYLQNTTNYGNEDTLYSGNGFLSLRRSYMKFTLPGMPDNTIIWHASLNFTQKSLSYSFSDDVKYIKLFDLTGYSSWTESGITWNNQPLSTTKNGPQTDGTPVLASIEGKSGSDHLYSVDITSKVRYWHNNTVNNNGFMISTSNENKNCQPSFYSSEASSHTPYVTLYYNTNIGLEDYWDFQTVDMGRSGTLYTNTYNGAYYYVHNDAATSGLVLPVGVSHIYGSPDMYNVNYGNMNFGRGFKLNLIEKISSSTYLDADGTEHKIVWKDSAYRVEDDPTTIYTTISGGYRLTYLNGATKTFNSSGFLTEIKDTNNNTIQITYTNNQIAQVTSGANQTISFTYDSNNYLTKITDNAGRETNYTYTGVYLTGITYPDGKHTYLSYSNGYLNEIKNNVNARWAIEFNTMYFSANLYTKMKSVTVYGENNSGSYNDKLNFTYYTFQSLVQNNHDDSVSIDYDWLGRPVSYTSKGNTSKIGYNNNGNLNNTVSYKSNPFSGNDNLFSRENRQMKNWSLYSSPSTLSCTLSTDRTNNYPTAEKITGNGSWGSVRPGSWPEGFTATPGNTYSVSVELNIIDTLQSGKVYLKLASGNVESTSPAITTTANSWMPLSASITVPAGQTTVSVYLVFEDFTGTVYCDIAQAIEGNTIKSYNMIPDPGFKNVNNSVSNYWQTDGGNWTTYDGRATVGATLTYTQILKETFPLKGNAGEEFVFGISEKSKSFPLGSDSYYGVKIVFISGGSDREIVSLPGDPNTEEWNHVLTKIHSNYNFDSVRIELHNDKQASSASFKDLFLYKGVVYGYNYDYNNNRQVTAVSDGIGNSKQISYNVTTHDVSGIQQISNNVTLGNTTYTYDNNHNILTASDSVSGITTSYTYPSPNKGLPLTATVTGSDSLSATTTYAYTSDNNYLTSVTDSSGAVISYSYDTSSGNLLTVTDPNGNETNYSYNSSNLISSIYADVGDGVAQVSYQYDGVNRLTKISTADVAYGFTYDLYGRNDKIKNGAVTLTDLTYNSDSTVSRVDQADGTYSTHTYDDKDRLTSTSYNGNLAYTYKYNDNNALTEVYDAENDNTTSYLYDPAGRTVGISRTDGKNSAFAYDAQGRPVKSVITDNNDVVSDQSYSYDNRNRVSGTALNNINGDISYSYDGLNRLTSSTGAIGTGSSVSNSYTYKANGSNQTGRIDSVTYNKTIGGVTSQLYPTLSYDYDNNGNITKVYENGVEKIRYYYDELNRLVREDNFYIYTTYVYYYDVNGDILLRERYSYSTESDIPSWFLQDDVEYDYTDSHWKNGVTRFNGDEIIYDANGNPTTYLDKTMTWDRNRLMSLTDSNYSMTFAYDENGLRTERNTGYDDYSYYYSGSQLVRTEVSGHTLDISYGADGRPFALKYDNTVYYYILNIQGDVLGLADASGNVVVKYRYDAWGKPGTSTIATGYGDIAYFNPLRYRGYVYDEESELYYLQSRYYDPQTGRFISADAYLVAGDHINSTNMFAYCLNNPVMYVDPRGYLPFDGLVSYLKGIIYKSLLSEDGHDYIPNITAAYFQAAERFGLSFYATEGNPNYVSNEELPSGLHRLTVRGRMSPNRNGIYRDYNIVIYYGVRKAWARENSMYHERKEKTDRMIIIVTAITSIISPRMSAALTLWSVRDSFEEDYYQKMIDDALIEFDNDDSLKSYAVIYSINTTIYNEPIYKYGKWM